MEQRINELRSKDHEARKVGFQRIIDVVVFVGCNFKVLFELGGYHGR
jgi:hypothetical protein